MPQFLRTYVHFVESITRGIGKFAMYLLFVMMGILIWSSITKFMHVPSMWTLEMAQFTLVAYYMLGAPWALESDANVRMDLLYGEWSLRKKAWFDMFTVFFLIVYLGVLLYGAVSSTAYSLGYWGTEPFSYFSGLLIGTEEVGTMERSSSPWRPYLWPIKVVMIVGFFMMLLQCISELSKDILRLKGAEI